MKAERGNRRAYDEVGDIAYRVAWKALSSRPGAHRSRNWGTGGNFRDLVPFMRAPEPRRIDLRQSLRDPWQGLHVRRFEQSSILDVVLLADMSGSMGFKGNSTKLSVLAELSEVLARSARRIGDRFGMIACDDRIIDELSVRMTRSRGGEPEMIERILRYTPRQARATGLIEAARSLAGRRRLVLIVSDFRLPEAELVALFDILSPHDVIPVVLKDSAETDDLPSWGFIELNDLESGRTRMVFMRPSLKDRLKREEQARADMLRRLFSTYAREPVVVTDKLDWHRLGAALLGAR